jgi:hypothetical protein
MNLLPPHDLQLVLENSQEYQQAKKLLWLDWDEEPNQLYHNPVTPTVVHLARMLQQAGLVRGRVDLANYREVGQMVGQHPRWFSATAKNELLKPFEE